MSQPVPIKKMLTITNIDN
jgi:hypothetical protein